MEKRNSTIEILRFLACILIVSIHAHIFSDGPRLLYAIIPMGIARVGVPLFLVIAGYFFYKRLEAGREYKTYMVRLFKAWGIFSILELIIAGAFYYPQFPEPFYFWQRFIMVGLGDAYWFLWAFPASILMLIPFWLKKSVLPGLVTGFSLFMLSMVNDSYSAFFAGTALQEFVKLHQTVFLWTGAGFVTTIFFLSMGAWFSKHEEAVLALTHKYGSILIVLALASLVLVAVETIFTMSAGCNDTMNKLSLLLAVPLLFMLCLRYQCSNATFDYLGSLGWYIYLIHPILLDISKMLALGSIARFLFAAGLSVILAAALQKRKMNL